MRGMANRSPGLRFVDVVYAGLALLSFCAIFTVPSLFWKMMTGYWAVACVAGLVLRWGWLLPSTLGTFVAIASFQPFLNGYTHTYEENVWHDLIYPTICAGIVATLQIAFAWLTKNPGPNDPYDRTLGRSGEPDKQVQ